MLSDSIFHSYDLRGIWPCEWDKKGVEQIAKAIVKHFSPRTIAIGRDMRLSSAEIFSVLAENFIQSGVEVWDLGLVSTDISYFTSGFLRPDLTLMITASHNPPEYNGLKITLPGGESISFETGFEAVKNLARQDLVLPKKRGRIVKKNLYPQYIKAVLSIAKIAKIKPLKIVVDAGNGMAGKVFPQVAKHLPIKYYPLYFELDGRFPHHLANPLLPEAVAVLKKAVISQKADLGVGFDGDGDRVVLIDEQGVLFSGTIITAMLAESILKDNPGRVVCYNAICGRVVPKIIKENNGIPLRTPVGYSLIKQIMREKNAVFAGEHSYHFFFPQLYFADSGIMALIKSLQLISQSGQKASEIRKKYDLYPQSGEINFQVEDKEGMMKKVEKKFSQGAAAVDHLDGVSLWFTDWWFNLRPSNTEPLLRLNIEADNAWLLAEKEKILLQFISEKGGKRI